MSRWAPNSRQTWRLLVMTALAAGTLTGVAPGAAQAASGPALVWSAPVTVEKAPFGTSFPLMSVACPSAMLCVAGDDLSDIFTSTDPGSPAPMWQQTVVGSKTEFQQTHVEEMLCPAVSFCLAIAPHGKYEFLTSTDPTGGASAWISSGANVFLDRVSCASADLCAAAAGKGQIAVSANPAAGAAAVWKTTAVDGTADIAATACPDTSFCAAVDNAGDVLTSTDPTGGVSAWQITNVIGSIGFGSLTCPSRTFCAASDDLGRLVYSTDPADGRSATWHSTTTPVAPECLSTSFCVGLGSAGVLFITDNPVGGSSAWQSNDIDGTTSLNFVSCASPVLCAAVDNSGNALTSTNPAGGPSAWNAQNIDGMTAIVSMECPSASLCVAGDDAGNILTSTEPAGGSPAWSAANVDGRSGHIEAIGCAGTSLCVAADRDGNIFTSTDPTGGPSAWSKADIDKTNGIISVACPTTTLCIAGDDAGDVLSSTDPQAGGSSWQVTSIGKNLDFVKVGCAATALCLAAITDEASGGGMVFTSTDQQGGSWHESVQFPAASSIGPVACPAISLCVADGTYDVGDNESPVIFSSTQPTEGIAAWNVVFAGPFDGASLSCPTTTFCVTAAGPGGGVFVSTDPAGLSGSAWQLSAGTVADVASCPSTTFCVAGTASGQIQIGVPPVPTTTTITSVTSDPVTGQPVKVKVKVSATQGTTAPTGTVTVSDGTRSCTATLTGSAGTATGECSLTEPTAGRFALSASYPAQGSFAASRTGSSTPLIVGKAASAITLTLSAKQVTYGLEEHANLSVRARPQFTGVPTGRVVILAGATRVCALVLRDARASCRLGATRLMAGRYRLTARYQGNGSFFGSVTKARTLLTVIRARSVTALKLSAARVKYGHEQSERLSVTVNPQFTGVPAGTVVVTAHRSTVCTLRLRNGKASCTLRRKQLRPGRYHLVASYQGSRDFTASTATATLAITR